jgi:homoserine kinase
MGGDPTELTTADLFSTNEVRDTSLSRTKPIAAPNTAADTSTQRHVLPKNLSHAVTQLSDTELNQLCNAAFDEAKRRRRFPVEF